MAVKAKLSVFPSFHPRRPNIPTFFVSSCSAFRPKPYLRAPFLRVAVMSGRAPLNSACRIASEYVPRVGVIRIRQHAHGSCMFLYGITILHLEHITAIYKQPPIKAKAIGYPRHRAAAISKGPVF